MWSKAASPYACVWVHAMAAACLQGCVRVSARACVCIVVLLHKPLAPTSASLSYCTPPAPPTHLLPRGHKRALKRHCRHARDAVDELPGAHVLVGHLTGGADGPVHVPGVGHVVALRAHSSSRRGRAVLWCIITAWCARVCVCVGRGGVLVPVAVRGRGGSSHTSRSVHTRQGPTNTP
jgi:hypothetical protein